MRPKVVFCVPVYPSGSKPHPATLASLRATVEDNVFRAEYDDGIVSESGNPYISAARATMLRKALDAKAHIVVFIDSDVSWRVEDMLTLLRTEGAVVGGTYRYKKGEADDVRGPAANSEEDAWYMGGYLPGTFGRPQVRESDGAIKMDGVPAGFLKVTRHAVNRLMEAYPELQYGEKCLPHFDLFQHGAHKGSWYGEDMAFCRRWRDLGETVWCPPNMNIDHHGAAGRFGDESQVWRGNYHRYLLAQPGGSDSNSPKSPAELALATRERLAEQNSLRQRPLLPA